MARITVEDCLNKVNNRFTLIHMAAKRVRQIRKGADPLVQSKNKDIVVALREIAAGRVFKTDRPRDLLLVENGTDADAQALTGETPPDMEKEDRTTQGS